MKVAFTWSKPNNIPRLIGRKQADQSLFTWGTHIPKEFHVDFAQANGGHLPDLGESREVILRYGGKEFTARLVCKSRHGPKSRDLSLEYGSRSGFPLLLQQRLHNTYQRLRGESNIDRTGEDMPGGEPEYVEFYETGEPYHYEVRLVTRAEGESLVPPEDFETVWFHLGQLIQEKKVIHTLLKGAVNTVSWTPQGIRVTTERGSEIISKATFQAAWQALLEREILPADEFPGEARFRSAAISAIFAQLPYVDYTTYPKITLFLTSHRFTNAELAQTFKVGTQRGIRVAGRAPETKLVVFTTGASSDCSVEHPYTDYWKGDTLFYTGEGLIGDQEMTHGNLALKNSMSAEFPVYGFRKLPEGGFAYLGRFRVNAVHEEQQPDMNGTPRRVYVFEMTRIRPQALPAEPLAHAVEGSATGRVFRISAPRSPADWALSREKGLLLLDVQAPATDLAGFTSPSGIKEVLLREMDDKYGASSTYLETLANELQTLKNLRPGDKLVVTRGANTFVGLAEVTPPGYTWLPSQERHAISVTWHWTGALRTTRRPEWLVATVAPTTQEAYEEVANSNAPKTEPTADLAEITRSFSSALRLSGIHFGKHHDQVVRAFIAALATKRFVILTGLSGSGKTQIALRFGDWLGKERRMVVPVRPDWTGPDYLFGYEDALKPLVRGMHPWHVPPVLAFMLRAARDPHYPYLLVLDEMNLAHVERYFADFLSGMESGEPCLPNLEQDPEGNWIIPKGAEERIPIPENLFVVGTVNVDETTYMFSPKVLDRANTFEFRVESDELEVQTRKPIPVSPGEEDLVRGFLAVATDDDWQHFHPAPWRNEFAEHLRTVHRLLAESDFEFGHRVFYEALRYASMLASTGEVTMQDALDQQIYQKVLPRLHGSRRRLEPLLRALGRFCYDLSYEPGSVATANFDPEASHEGQPQLPLSYRKVCRMFRSLRVNQFTSFTE